MSDLAVRIAAAAAPATQVSLDFAPDDSAVRRALVERLMARGVRVIDAATGVAAARAQCLENLRERTCTGEVVGDARRLFVVARPRAGERREPASNVALDLRPIISQRARMLDVTRSGAHLLVLTPAEIIRYEQVDGGWRAALSRSIGTSRIWPRDVRGRLHATSAGIEAFLPGIKCLGTGDSLTMTCADSSDPWPLDFENARVDPARNYFRTTEGVAFYGIARTGSGTDAAWLAATVDRVLTFIDADRVPSATPFSGDDVARVQTACGEAPYVVVGSAASGGEGDQLTLFRVAGHRLISAAPAIGLRGRLIALWTADGADAATVITHDLDAGRYDAYELTASCSR